MKILAFCFFPAFVPPSNGGQSRLYNFYRALSRWHQVTLLTSTHVNIQEEVIQHGLNFVERRISKDNYFVQQWGELEKYSSGGDLSAPTIAACGRLPTRLHQAYLDEYEKAEIIFHDFPFAIDYDLFSGIDLKPRVYNAHNCETILYQQLHPSDKSKPIHEIVRVAEQRVLEAADLVLYCNESDLEAFHLLAPSADFDALYAPNGMTPITTLDYTHSYDNKAFRAVFMGSGHLPNLQAATFIAQTLAPAFPDIIFDIIGSCLSEDNYYPNVIRHGVVDDGTKMHILSQADLALNPMAAGSGSNVKVLEYFAYGIPVLSTSFGMRGIQAQSGTHYLEARLDHFVSGLRQAISVKESLIFIGKAGKYLALRQYTWDAIARPVEEYLDAIVNFKKPNKQKRFVLALNDYDSFAGIGGGGTRTRGLYEALREWTQVVFVSFSDDDSIGARKYDKGITVINVPKTSEHIAELKRVNVQFHVSANDIIAIKHCMTNPWMSAVYKVLRQFARHIILEHCYLAALPLSWDDRFIYSSHNNETELKKRLLEWHPLKNQLVADVERIERLAVERSAATIVVSHEDAESLVKGKRTAGPVTVVRNGAALPASGAKVKQIQQTLQNEIGTRAVVFLGSAHMPNVDAAQFIIDHLAPQCPNVKFHLLGSVCGAIQQIPENVHLWGVVDEITKSAVMQSCELALNPMASGSGSNVKLADYLSNGLFVITTEFGQRGYPSSVHEHLAVAPMDGFVALIQEKLDDPEINTEKARTCRKILFERELAMSSIARRFAETLKALEKKKKRVLFVGYRYTSPALGGAEINFEKFLSALGNSGEFDVDVVVPEVSHIHNNLRFSENYTFDAELDVPTDIPNVRFARFPVDTPSQEQIFSQLRKAWAVQPSFERVVDQALQKNYQESGLTWGWGYPEINDATAARWAFTECGIFLYEAVQIYIDGYSSHAVVTTVYSGNSIIAGPWSIEGPFSCSFQAHAVGELRFVTSVPQSSIDPRPLALRISSLKLDGTLLNLSTATLPQKFLLSLPAAESFRLLDQAAELTRVAQGVRLTDGRGPWSNSLEQFIRDNVKDYDLVITHNNVFRPAVIALEEAKKHSVPSILIPHAHLDDDFYHFPDLIESARNASLVLAVPQAACDFFAEKGCNVRYLPAGCDTSEQYTKQDQEAFKQIHPANRPFILVLGRKAGAKGYRQIIDAAESLNRDGVDVEVVLIGPDDDRVAIKSTNAVYLGRQPRNVVRGALLSCLALCNMSSSESFGIVLLEAWMAGKSVIANKNCAAFHDMAINDENALLVSDADLSQTIKRLINDPTLAWRLAKSGKRVVERFNWNTVAGKFVEIVRNLLNDC